MALKTLQSDFRRHFPQKQWVLCEKDRLQYMVRRWKRKKNGRPRKVNKKGEEDAVEEDTISNVENQLKTQKDKLQLATLLLQSAKSKFHASDEIPNGSMAAEMETLLKSILDMKSSISPLLSVKDNDLCNEACQMHSSLFSLADEIAKAYNDFEWSRNYLHSVYMLRRD